MGTGYDYCFTSNGSNTFEACEEALDNAAQSGFSIEYINNDFDTLADIEEHETEIYEYVSILFSCIPDNFDPMWFTWNDKTPWRILNTIVTDADLLEKCPILADSLEDAGCSNQTLLDWLRDSNMDADDTFRLLTYLRDQGHKIANKEKLYE